jgi:WD40 repeat protein
MSDLGVQIWSADGDNMLFFYALSSLLGTQYDDARFMRGATGQDAFLCVGCSTGAIVVFDCSFDLAKGNFLLIHSLESQEHAICSLSSSPTLLTAADDHGNIFAYGIDSAFELSFTLRGAGQPCTSMFSTEHVIFAGYTTGHIRVYRIDTRELAVEVTAHARLVSALAYDEASQLAASCSADQYVHVWTVPNFRSKANSSLDCMYSAHLENKMAMGVTFVNEQKMCVACYDEEELVLFNRV